MSDQSYEKPCLPPGADWSAGPDPGHLVQFYEGDDFLVHTIAEYIASALDNGHGGIVIASQRHLEEVESDLRSRGVNLSAARRSGQYVGLDAALTLAEFMEDGWPNERRFAEVVGELVSRMTARHPAVRAFGEMVALLWAEGKHEAAIRLEGLWNELAQVHSFSLCCAYPLACFASHVHGKPFLELCAAHSRVLPSESYLTVESSDARMNEVAQLQQRMAALSGEVEAHRETARVLGRRERELSDFLEHAVEGLNRIGPDGTILWANRAELALLGYTKDEYVGHHISEFHVDPHAAHDLLAKVAKRETLLDYPARLRCKDGSIKHVLIHSNALWEDEKLVYAHGFTRDVTDRVLLEQAMLARLRELGEADRRKDEFLAMLGHELRNPLSPIFAALEIMQMPGADASAIRASREAIGRQVRHLTRIVDDLLDVSRISSGKIKLRRQRVDLSAILAHALETTRPSIEAGHHRLSVVLPQTPLLVDGDTTRLEQVFTNLLSNAAKYTNAGGDISLVAQADGERAIVSIEDTGVGISRELLPRLFVLFTQADRSLDRSRGGLGIGLWMARRLVELHGGDLEPFSEGPGKGSRFVVTLPRIETRAEAPIDASTATPHPDAQCHRILVVDDNRDAAEIMALHLRMSGHDVRVGHDGLTAVQLAVEHRADVVLLDIGLPGLDGYAVATRLRSLEPSSARRCLIALTGYGSDEDRQRAHAAGFDYHFVKPLEPQQLTQLLDRLPPA